MNNRYYSKDIKEIRFNFMRINKNKASAAYRAGLTVLWSPVNIEPFTGWGLDMPINANNQNCDGCTFEEVLDKYLFYNCNNSKVGRYPAYYIPVRDVDRFTGEISTAETMGIIQQYDYRYLEV